MAEHEPENAFELENFLPYRLSVLTNTISQGIAAAYRDRFDINITEWRVLAVIGHYPGLTASDVVERTAMDKVAISRAVKSMEEKTLLERIPDDKDRRRNRLFLTPGKGRQILAEIIPRAREFELRLLASLSPSDRHSLDRIIEALSAYLSDLPHH